MSTDGQTHTRTHAQTHNDFIICPMLYAIAMGQIIKPTTYVWIGRWMQNRRRTLQAFLDNAQQFQKHLHWTFVYHKILQHGWKIWSVGGWLGKHLNHITVVSNCEKYLTKTRKKSASRQPISNCQLNRHQVLSSTSWSLVCLTLHRVKR